MLQRQIFQKPMTVHIPVLLDEALQWLDLQPGQVVVDGTMGGGGHTREFAKAVGPTGRVIALDRDPSACLLYTSPSPRDS